MESWLPVVGWEDRYKVSDLGRVRSLDITDRRGVFHPDIILKLGRHEFGYPTVTLSRDGRSFRKLVHTLILEAFVGPRPRGYHALHRDGIPANTYLSNLEWGTRKQNQQDMARHGRAGRFQASKTKCPKGHEYTVENTYTYRRKPRGEGRTVTTERGCRICRNDAAIRFAKSKGAQ